MVRKVTSVAFFLKDCRSFSSHRSAGQFFRSRAPPSYSHTFPSYKLHSQKCLSSCKANINEMLSMVTSLLREIEGDGHIFNNETGMRI